MANDLVPNGGVYASPTLPATPEPSHDLGAFQPGLSPLQRADLTAIGGLARTVPYAGPFMRPTAQMQELGPNSSSYASAADID